MRSSLQKGFTLIELLVVMAIIGILIAALLPNLMMARNKAYDGSAVAFLRHCISAMEMKRNQEGYVVNATSCDDSILGDAAQILPPAVKSTQIYPNANLSDYTIDVTSVTGKNFKYENGKFIGVN